SVRIGRIAGALVDATTPHSPPRRTSLALRGSEPDDLPPGGRVGGDERVALPHQGLVEQLVPEPHVREGAAVRIDPLDVEPHPHPPPLSRSVVYEDASIAKHCTGSPGATDSGVSMPIRRTVSV